MEARRCSRCGLTVHDPDIRFCEKCGVVLVDEKEYNERIKPSFLRKILLTSIVVPFRKILPTIAGISLRKALLIASILIIIVMAVIVLKEVDITPDIEIPEKEDRQFEAMEILEEIYAAEIEFHQMEGRYSTDPHEIGLKNLPKSRGYKFKIIYADSESFSAMAWGNIDIDNKIDIWEVTEEDMVPVCIYDDIENEGKNIDPLKYEESRVSELKGRSLSNTRFKLLNRRFEAYRILNGIYQAELAYREKEAVYSASFDEIGFELASEPKFYQFKIVRADKDSFAARAWGNIDEDAKIDILEVTEKDSGKISCIYDDVTDFEEEIDPLILKEIKPLLSELIERDLGLLEKRSEVLNMLEGIYKSEFEYRETEDIFSSDLDEMIYDSTKKPKYYKFKIIHADEEGFIVRGWGNIDVDDKIDIWEVTNKDIRPVCIYDDINNKGEEIDPLKLR